MIRLKLQILVGAAAMLGLLALPQAAFAQAQRDDTPPVAFGDNTEKNDDEEADAAAPPRN